MAYKQEIKEFKKEKKRFFFWDKILKQDINKQANFVELMGWLGLIAFLILAGILWTVKINVTVPAKEAKLVEWSSGYFVVEAEVLEKYASNISEKQKVSLRFLSTQGEKIRASGEIVEIGPKINVVVLMIKVKPDLDMQTLKKFAGNLRSIQLRIIIQRKKLISLFIEKQL